jgi:ribosomal protein L29
MSDFKLLMKDLVQQDTNKLYEIFILHKKSLFNLRFQLQLGELKSTEKISLVKKNIARIKTELNKRSKLGA